MAKITASSVNELLVQLTLRVNELSVANALLTERLDEAHGRIDHAARIFKELRNAVDTPPAKAMRAKREPDLWRIALDELRDEAGDPAAYIDGALIKERAETLRTMRANSVAAGEH